MPVFHRRQGENRSSLHDHRSRRHPDQDDVIDEGEFWPAEHRSSSHQGPTSAPRSPRNGDFAHPSRLTLRSSYGSAGPRVTQAQFRQTWGDFEEEDEPFGGASSRPSQRFLPGFSRINGANDGYSAYRHHYGQDNGHGVRHLEGPPPDDPWWRGRGQMQIGQGMVWWEAADNEPWDSYDEVPHQNPSGLQYARPHHAVGRATNGGYRDLRYGHATQPSGRSRGGNTRRNQAFELSNDEDSRPRGWR